MEQVLIHSFNLAVGVNMNSEQGSRIPCVVILSKTIQEHDYEPFVIELQETRWVTDEQYEEAHYQIYDRLEKRMDVLISERLEKINGSKRKKPNV